MDTTRCIILGKPPVLNLFLPRNGIYHITYLYSISSKPRHELRMVAVCRPRVRSLWYYTFLLHIADAASAVLLH